MDRRIVFSGQAIGVGLHFNHFDNVKVDHAIPAMGATAIPIVGGASHQKISNQRHTVDHPRHRTVLEVGEVESNSVGRILSDTEFATEIHCIVRALAILEQLYVDNVELHQTSTIVEGSPSEILTRTSKIDGLRLGNVRVKVELDNEPFATCGTRRAIEQFYASQSDAYRRENCERFNTPEGAPTLADHRGRCHASVVKKIELEGPDDEKSKIKVDRHSIIWDGFGKIFLGEVIVTDKDRRVTMMRLKMGSSAGGTGGVTDGQTNSIIVS